MNPKFQWLIFLTALFTISIPVRAQSAIYAASGSITVNGEAEIRVVPDEVVLTLGVETFDKILKPARSLNDERIKKTIAIAKGHGIPAEYIQTDYLGIEPRYQTHDAARDLIGYVVRKTVVIRLKDISKFEELLSDVLEAGVTHVHGIEFRTTELRKHRDEARRLAMRAAREKAELLANEAGRKVGKTLSIGESSFGYWSSYGSWWGNRYGSGMAQNVVQNIGGASISTDNTLAPGQIAIRAIIGASFALE
ncbi:MAG: SIMPL domain-containing protein [Acidobacteriota bacterium]